MVSAVEGSQQPEQHNRKVQLAPYLRVGRLSFQLGRYAPWLHLSGQGASRSVCPPVDWLAVHLLPSFYLYRRS